MRRLACAFVFLSTLAAGCSKSPESTERSETPRAQSDSSRSLEQFLALERDQFVSAVRQELDGAQAKIDELQQRARAKGGQIEEETRELLAGLETKREQVRARLSDLEQAAGESWRDLRDGIVAAYDDLRASIDRGRERIDAAR